jgi:Fe-S-cluster containining protein
MKRFIDTTDQTFTFSSCEGCPARCCDGKEGSIFSELILEDFEQVAKNFPIVFTFGELGFLKANVLLSNGKDFCPYNINYKCTIYDERPAVCGIYPLSQNVDNKVYIDDLCPALNSDIGIKIVDSGVVSKNFFHKKLDNYQDKFIDTHTYLQQFNQKCNFKQIGTINNICFYEFIEDSNDRFIQLHIQSMKNLNKVLKWN